MSIKSRLICLNVVVVTIAMVLGGALVYRSYVEAHQLRNFSKVSTLLRQMFQLGHAWTQESGGVWHAHKDFANPGKLEEGRHEYNALIAKTQAVAKDIDSTVASLPLNEMSEPFREMVRSEFDFEKRVSALRTGIVVENVHPWQTTLLYNREIKRMFGFITQLATETSDAELVRKVIVADLTLQAQLMIDRHNGLLSYALGSGDVNEAQGRFPAFIDDVRPLLRRIESLSSPEGVRLFKAHVDNDSFKRFEEATELVIKAGPPPAGGRHTFDKEYAKQIKQTYFAHGKEVGTFIEFIQADVENYTRARMKEADVKMYLSASAVGIAFLLSLVVGLLTIRHTTQSIRTVAGQLTDASRRGNLLSFQVSTAASSLADGCSEQASAIEEIHATVEEINSLARRESERVDRVQQLARDSDASVSESSASTKKMRDAMQRILESNAQIANITKTVEEIAFQTNILALNAAVEAARAGEAGAGFAVVAEEVRSLAHKSAESAQSTHQMIEKAIRSVHEGDRLSQEVDKQLTRVLDQISGFKTAMREIQEGAQHQRTAIAQVATSIGEIEKVTQRNASAAEESAAASHEMEAQSRTVLDQIDYLEAILIGARSGSETAVPAPVDASPAAESTRQRSWKAVERQSSPTAATPH